MDNITKIVKGAAMAIGGAIGWFIGNLDGTIYTLLAVVIIDYLTGVTCAIINKELSSKIGFKGIAKKMFIFLLVGIAHLFDVNILHTGETLRTATIFFFIANEGISILENAISLGLPIPNKLKNVFEKMKDEDADKESESKKDEE